MSRWVTHPYLCPPNCPACRDNDARAEYEEGMEPDRAEERIEDERERAQRAEINAGVAGWTA